MNLLGISRSIRFSLVNRLSLSIRIDRDRWVKPVDPVQSGQSVKPVDPVQSGQSVKPVDPGQSGQSVKPVDPGQSGQSSSISEVYPLTNFRS